MKLLALAVQKLQSEQTNTQIDLSEIIIYQHMWIVLFEILTLLEDCMVVREVGFHWIQIWWLRNLFGQSTAADREW